MAYHEFDDLIDDLTPEQEARVEALKDEARAEMVAYTPGASSPSLRRSLLLVRPRYALLSR